MTRLITDEQILAVYQVLQDVTGLVECNCSIDGCEGDCTYACAVAGIAILDALPVASQEAATGPQEAQEAAAGAEWDAESRLSEIAELLDGVFEPLPKGGDEGDRTFIETAYIIAMGNRLCPAHRECLVADACTMGYARCEANQ